MTTQEPIEKALFGGERKPDSKPPTMPRNMSEVIKQIMDHPHFKIQEDWKTAGFKRKNQGAWGETKEVREANRNTWKRLYLWDPPSFLY